jgi:hypothetical protein
MAKGSKAKKAGQEKLPLDQLKVTEIQAHRLAELANADAKEFAGKKIAEVHDKLRWVLDPELLLHRRVCGRVVKRNPATGELEPVPNATVHVYDTDCSFMIFSPPHWPWWSWLFPLVCKRELLATVTTDHCGRFCVWIPRWDIDWIVKWRKARLCFRDLFRPRWRHLIERLEFPKPLPEPPVLRRPPPPTALPLPLPYPVEVAVRQPEVLGQLREIGGPELVEYVEALVERSNLGARREELDTLLDTPVVPLPPPLPGGMLEKSKKAMEESGLALLGLTKEHVRSIDFSHWVGPFWRCVEVTLGIWTPIFDVPDITFEVTQDIDDDGQEETIYSEGFFDVRWDSGPIGDVTLEASAIARSVPTCEGPTIDPSECTEPTIVTAGLMPLRAPQFDVADGYALSVNRPRPGGLSTSPQAATGKAPFWRTLQLHGCHRFAGAAFYRLVYSYDGSGEIPFTGLTWWAARLSDPPLHIVPDSDGWYPILPAANLVFPHWLLNWETWRFANGKYTVRLILGDAAKVVVGQSAPVSFRIDNTRPQGFFTQIRWRVSGIGTWQILPAICPVITRPAASAVELEVTYQVSAPHFRNVFLKGYGCGSGGLTKLSTIDKFDRWHTSPSDNSWTATAMFEVSGASRPGVYTVGLDVYGRAFNPAGGGSGPSTNWNYDVEYSRHHPRRHIAIVDA